MAVEAVSHRDNCAATAGECTSARWPVFHAIHWRSCGNCRQRKWSHAGRAHWPPAPDRPPQLVAKPSGEGLRTSWPVHGCGSDRKTGDAFRQGQVQGLACIGHQAASRCFIGVGLQHMAMPQIGNAGAANASNTGKRPVTLLLPSRASSQPPSLSSGAPWCCVPRQIRCFSPFRQA